ncbi:MAG: PEP-CTERM sorting domain-containing protein [Burkholderiales bacterium]|nr:MAG: PEP-CTERM sorting domain-containing protein [Burkholderiales bacterium]
MSVLVTFALAVSAGATLPQCSWDRPGVNPFMGDVVAAVDRYTDMPAATRAKLKARMKARSYDDIALIERDSITGRAAYAPEIRDMHFGPGAVCRTVTRTKWTASTQERGLVYCEDGQCILVPTVCRNVSRIRRLDKPNAVAPAQAVNLASSTREGEEVAPLMFEPPAAGPMVEPPSFASTSGVPSLAPTVPSDGGLRLAAGPGPSPLATPGASPAPVTGGIPSLPPGRPTTTDAAPPPETVPSVPEPGTWALILVGVGVVALRTRQRR